MEFYYPEYWKWFRDDPEHILTQTDDVFATVFTVNHQALKYQPPNTDVPFLTHNMRAMRVADDDVMAQPFSSNLFVVMEEAAFRGDEKALRRKNMFVVFPKTHIQENSATPLVSADHFSFVIGDPGRRKTPLHFHMTQYLLIEGRFGAAAKADNYMPMRFPLPAVLAHERIRDHHAQQIQAVLARPTTMVQAAATPESTLPAEQTGGGRSRMRHIRVSSTASFEDLWHILPLNRITVFGIRAREGYDVTVFVTDRLRHNPYTTFHSYAFHTDRPGGIPGEIARLMGGLSWDSFADAPDDAENFM